ncbi:MAG: hypothetical protein K9W45_07700 [Candidatus Heimdallarchaeum aukensis]|uniref:Uncharacterized protein n=1 Tax=Candidatus Heimdallarchaeum aukensis TaxID=2876573 RepID=A0A9Y1BIM4_9ARCH|nr:MAG: hypothetical protein K9W45_07700 [Candidatus Heimdallarchaeum aukensis]
MRKMVNFVHFYFGDADETFYTGIGTAIRALGHGKKVQVILTDKKFYWVEKISTETDDFRIFKLKTKNDINFLKEIINSSEQELILISDIDLLIQNNWITAEHLKDIVLKLKEKKEVIITSMSFYKSIANIADYCSHFSKEG